MTFYHSYRLIGSSAAGTIRAVVLVRGGSGMYSGDNEMKRFIVTGITTIGFLLISGSCHAAVPHSSSQSLNPYSNVAGIVAPIDSSQQQPDASPAAKSKTTDDDEIDNDLLRTLQLDESYDDDDDSTSFDYTAQMC